MTLRERIDRAIDDVALADNEWRANYTSPNHYAVYTSAREYFAKLLDLAVAQGEMTERTRGAIWLANK